jgi:hypothetical protein
MQTGKNVVKSATKHITLTPIKENSTLNSETELIKKSSVKLNIGEIALLKSLLKDMAAASNILLWNQLRRFAKKKYPMKIIGVLDASGYINTVLPRFS